jgi:hypothetical protein
MPLQWTISHAKRLVIAIAKGELQPAMMIEFLAQLDAAGARPYAKMFGIDQPVTAVSDENVLALANLVRSREQESIVGPIAIIARDDAIYEQARLFTEIAEIERPIRVFREWHEARRWIDALARSPLARAKTKDAEPQP